MQDMRLVTLALSLLIGVLAGPVHGEPNARVTFALTTQRNLISDFTINKAPLVGTHNSYSSAGYGSLFANQNLSLSAQFDIGVRYIELDLHYVPELNDTNGGPYRICHASGAVWLSCGTPSIGWDTCNQLGVQNYGLSNTGCTSATPNFVTIFNEIAQWLNSNPANIIVINLDDSMPALTNDAALLINGWLQTAFGTSTYTPQDLVNDAGQWPTITTLISRGKKLIFNTNKNNFGGTIVHNDLRGFVWPASKIKLFTGYPNCSSSGYSFSGSFGFFQEDRLVISISGNLVYNGPPEVGLFDAANSLAVMECQFTTYYDFLSVESAEQLIWSWDVDQPKGSGRCASLNPQTGRWVVEDCTSVSHLFACRSNTNSSQWTLGSVSSTRHNYTDSAICPPDYSFSTPRTAYENLLLRTSIQSSSNVWISMNQHRNGSWSDVPTKDFPLATPAPNGTTSVRLSSYSVVLLILASVICALL